MTRFHFSLAGLLAAVGVLAIAFAMLRSQSELLAALAYTGNIGLLGFAIVGLIWTRGHDRLFWIGFVVLGGIYNSLAFRSSIMDYLMPYSHRSDLLVTTQLLDRLHAMRPVSLQVDGRVSVNYRGTGTYYPGRIRAITSVAYDIAFDDGSQEWAPASRLRSASVPGQPLRLQVGEAVMANFRGTGTFFPGRIRAVEDKMYDIAFDDGSQDLSPASRLRAGSPEAFFDLGHAIIAPFVGLLGGVLSVFVFGRNDGNTNPTETNDSRSEG